MEPPLQLARAQAQLAGQRGQIGCALRAGDPVDGLGDQPVSRAGSGCGLQEGGLHRGDGIGQFQRAIEVAREGAGEIFHGCKSTAEFLHGWREQLGSPVRMETDSEHAGRAAGTQKKGAVDLSGEKMARLGMPLTVLEGLEWPLPIEDQLAMTVGDYALRRGVLAVVFENPETVDKRLKPLRWPDFGISNHLGMIARHVRGQKRKGGYALTPCIAGFTTLPSLPIEPAG